MSVKKKSGTIRKLALPEFPLPETGTCSPTVYESAMVLSVVTDEGYASMLAEWIVQRQNQDGSFGETGFEVVPTFAALYALVKRFPNDPSYRFNIDRALRWVGNDTSRSVLPNSVSSEAIVALLRFKLLKQLEALGDPDWTAYRDKISANIYENELDQRQLRDIASKIRSMLLDTDRAAEAKKYIHLYEIWSLVDKNFPALAYREGDLVGNSVAATMFVRRAHDLEVNEIDINGITRDGKRSYAAITVCTGMTWFETLWSLAPNLWRSDVSSWLNRGFSEVHKYYVEGVGIGGGPGLPPDADDTAFYNLLLSSLRGSYDEKAMERYWNGSYFLTYLNEDSASETTNTHCGIAVLDAINRSLVRDESGAVTKIVCLIDWLLARQAEDGCWYDKWHASPIYATSAVLEFASRSLEVIGGAKCALTSLEVLDKSGRLAKSAVDALLKARSVSGLWGYKKDNLEETAMAILALTNYDRISGSSPVIDFDDLRSSWVAARIGGVPLASNLWMGKDLYSPQAVASAYAASAEKLLVDEEIE